MEIKKMQSNLIEKLHEFSEQKMPNNRALNVILTFWNVLSQELTSTTPQTNRALFESFQSYYRKYLTKTDASPTISKIPNKPKETDFRLKWLKIANVRGIGAPKANIPFGINLFQVNTPRNAVIIGRNGSGKTTVFSALEYIYCNQIGEKEFRSFPGTNEDYLKNLITNQIPSIEVLTMSATASIDNPIYRQPGVTDANPSVSFLSEFDIIENGTQDIDTQSYTNKIAAKLGFAEFVNFKLNLGIMNSYGRVKERNAFRDATSEMQENTKQIAEIKKTISTLSEETTTQPKQAAVTDEFQRLTKQLETIGNLRQSKFNIPNFERLAGVAADYVKHFELPSSESMNIDESKIDFLEHGLRHMVPDGNCPFCESSTRSAEEIRQTVERHLQQYSDLKKHREKIKEHFEITCVELRKYLDQVNHLNSILQNEILTITKLLPDAEINSLQILIQNSEIDFAVEEKKIADLSGKGYAASSQGELKIFIQNDLGRLNPKNAWSLINEYAQKREKYFQTAEETIKNTLKNLNSGNDLLNRLALLNSKRQELKTFEARTAELIKQVNDTKLELDTYEAIKTELAELLQVVSTYIDELVQTKIEPFAELIKSTLDIFVQSDNMTTSVYFEMEKVNDVTTPKLQIKLVSGSLKLDPKTYFNNARYKIFATAVAIAIALASRANTGINIPLVMDDEFFDCDIINRAEFENFFLQVLRLYKKLTPAIPLQFIIFTHDEMVFESTRRAILETENDELLGELALGDRTIFARIIPSLNTEEAPKSLPDGSQMWDLLYYL